MDKFNLIMSCNNNKAPLISLNSTLKGKRLIQNMINKMSNEELELALEQINSYERRAKDDKKN